MVLALGGFVWGPWGVALGAALIVAVLLIGYLFTLLPHSFYMPADSEKMAKMKAT
jgi:hypothetical protein